MNRLSEFNILSDYLVGLGVAAYAANLLNMIILLCLAIVVAYIAKKLAKKIIVNIFGKLSRKTKTVFDDFLVKRRFLNAVANIAPYIVIKLAIPLVFADYPQWVTISNTVADVYFVYLFISIVRAFLLAVKDYSKTKESLKDKPVESFIQVVFIFLYIVGAMVVFSLLTGKSVWAFLTAMGAASAILLLVFKDTIMGFVASIQVASNDMVRIGDWISMEKYGADGDVIEINLATVKVQNWDKTITTIPTYYLISDSFKNWRGMQQTGGRRIMRSIHIQISSIRHLTPEDIEALSQVELIKDYLARRSAEIEEYNTTHNINRSVLINGYNLTNIGVFRKYINEYLAAHPGIHKGLTLMVRQLAPTTTGVPIQLYAFTSDIRWAVYEDVMSDIFDHLLASIKYFGLEVFEVPASSDVRQLTHSALISNKRAPASTGA